MKTIQFDTMIGGLQAMSSISHLLGLSSSGNSAIATIETLCSNIGLIKTQITLESGKEYEINNSLAGGLLMIQNASIEHTISLILSIANNYSYVIHASNGVSVVNNETAKEILVYRKETNGGLFIKNNSNLKRVIFVCYISIK